MSSYREMLGPAMEITDQKQANAYFKILVKWHSDKFGTTRERAAEVSKANLRYFSGYYDNETVKRVNELFHCPISQT